MRQEVGCKFSMSGMPQKIKNLSKINHQILLKERMNMSINVLVTGGTGYLGSILCEHLLRMVAM